MKIEVKKHKEPGHRVGTTLFRWSVYLNGVKLIDKSLVLETNRMITTEPPKDPEIPWDIKAQVRTLVLALHPGLSDRQKAYVMRLRGVDWWACMSDDGRVAREGAAHEAAVRKEGECVELDGLYERYRTWVMRSNREAVAEPFTDGVEVVWPD